MSVARRSSPRTSDLLPAVTADANNLGGMRAEKFLRDYWQKKPLLIRQAMPEFESPLDADELAGLACEEGIESRLIVQNEGNYQLEQGPFKAKRFSKLPERNWTLLVQDVEKHLPQFAVYLDQFDFLPHWRIDDLMISHAATGGSVGPHTDAYDVFLLQAKGRRRWSIAEHFNAEIIPGMDVKVLKEFRAEQSWDLEPGDMLYLPPNVAHEGVALDDDCMTWSIGFRAPSLRDMFLDFSEWMYQRLPDDMMYTDADLTVSESGTGQISPAAFQRMRDLLQRALNPGNSVLDDWFGQFMTEPKPWLNTEPSEDAPPADVFSARLEAGDALLRDSRARLAWSESADGTILFVNGESWRTDTELAALLELLCTQRRFTAARLDEYLQDAGITLLLRLHQAGALHFASTVEAEND